MLGSKPNIYWRICWRFLCPISLIFVLIFQWIRYTPPLYGNITPYPPWAEVLGWFMVFSSVIWIPVVGVYLVWKEIDGTICERMRMLSLPSVYWGPALIKHRRLVTYVEGFVVDPWAKEPPAYTSPTWSHNASLLPSSQSPNNFFSSSQSPSNFLSPSRSASNFLAPSQSASNFLAPSRSTSNFLAPSRSTSNENGGRPDLPSSRQSSRPSSRDSMIDQNITDLVLSPSSASLDIYNVRNNRTFESFV